MFKIRVKGYLTLIKALDDRRSLEICVKDAVTIRQILGELSERFGEPFDDIMYDRATGEISSSNQILLNGRHYKYLPNQLNTALNDGDELALFPPVVGG
jgi:MoaD family protein